MRLDDVEALIRARIPDLDAQITAGTISEALVVLVECDAVLRLLRNPGGYRSETIGEYSYQLDTRGSATGALMILDSEWALLGVSAGAFTVAPYLESPPIAMPVPPNWWELNL